jgi:uncharacterized protein
MHREKALIEIRLAGLSMDVHEFDFTIKAEEFNDPGLTTEMFPDELSVSARVEKSENEITVDLTTNATAHFTCDICLAPLTRELHGSYRVYYVFDQSGGDVEPTDEDYRLIDESTVSIDLTEDVRETLLLSIPMKVTCSDNPDCRVFHGGNPSGTDAVENSSWLESLDKLKKIYR